MKIKVKKRIYLKDGLNRIVTIKIIERTPFRCKYKDILGYRMIKYQNNNYRLYYDTRTPYIIIR